MARPGRQSAIYGDAVTSDGRGLPMTIESSIGFADKAGIDPRQLDAAVVNLVNMVDGGSALLLESAPMLGDLMKLMKKEVAKQVVRFEEIAEADANAVPGEVQKPGITLALATLLDLANRISILLERVDKMVLSGAKAKDLVVRLRTFIATGDEKEHGLENMSEDKLRRLINATARGEDVPELDRNG